MKGRKNQSAKNKGATKCTMRKAQIIGQVFIFIIAAAVFVLVLSYGYRTINKFITRQQDITLIDFKTELKSAVERQKLSFGSIEKLELRVPSKYGEMCIASSTDYETPPGNFALEKKQYYQRWLTRSENIFLTSSTATETPPILAEDVEVTNGYFCEKVKGLIALKLTGKGNRTLVELWPKPQA